MTLITYGVEELPSLADTKMVIAVVAPAVSAIACDSAPSARSTPLTEILPVVDEARVGVTVALVVPLGTITS